MSLRNVFVFLFLFSLTFFSACETQPKKTTPGAPQDLDWRSYNGDLTSQRFSILNQINTQNAKDVKKLCEVKLGDDGTFESGILVVQKTLYVNTSHSVTALDSTNCAVQWHYSYKPEEKEVFPVNRGSAYWDGKIFRGTADGRLLALDAQTGKELWRKKIGNPKIGEFVSASPIAWNNLVFIGPAGGDWGIRGRICAYHTENGEQAWCFHTIPMGKETGADSWHIPATAKRGGGATWTSYTLDPATGELFIPTGNPAPDFDSAKRPGDNLFTDSVVVLDAKTGQLKWYYQLVANDALDYDLASPPFIYSTAQGEGRVGFAGKNGHLYSITRADRTLRFKVPVTTISNMNAKPTKEGVHVCPGWLGGVEWNGPAFDHETDSIYVGAVDWCGTYKLGPARYKKGDLYLGTVFVPNSKEKPMGWITRFDAIKGDLKWQYHADAPIVAGVTPTAGGILITGDIDGNLMIFNKETGNLLYKNNLGGGLAGGIITYAVGGKQYIAATSGNISRTTFQTTGSPTLVILTTGVSSDQPQVVTVQNLASSQAQETLVHAGGQQLFQQFCASCHGARGEGGSGPAVNDESSRKDLNHLISWIKKPNPPMPKLYPSPLTDDEVKKIAKYVEAMPRVHKK